MSFPPASQYCQLVVTLMSCLPGAPIYRLQREEVKKAVLTQVVDGTENNPFGDGSIDDNFKNVAAMMDGPVATGQRLTLAEMMGVDKMTMKMASSAGSPPSEQASGSAVSSDGVGLGGGLAWSFKGFPDAPTESVPRRQPQDKEPKTTKITSRTKATTPPSKGAKAKETDSLGAGPGSDTKNNKGRGRPRRDVGIEMEKLVKEFEVAAESDTTWFGDNLKARDRNVKRLMTDVEGRMKCSECSIDECQKLRLQTKQVESIMHICRFLAAHGHESDGFVSCFDEQSTFMQMEPTVASSWEPSVTWKQF